MSPVQSGSRSLFQQAATLLALATLPARPNIEEIVSTVSPIPAVRASNPESIPTRSIANEGDPSRGVVHFLMQIHTVGLNTNPELLSIGKYQGAILSELLRLDVTHIFKEGLSTEVSPNWIHEQIDIGYAQELFLGVEPEDWTEPQFRLLASYGAETVYATLRPDVTLHPTARPSFEANIHDWIDNELNPFEQECLTMEVREIECATVARETIERLGAVPVAVIYGRDHVELPRRFLDLGFEQRMEVADWPKISERHFQNFCISDEKDPARQLELVRSAHFIDYYVFPELLTEDARRLALEKLNVKFEGLPGGVSELAEMLLDSCVTDALKQEIKDHEKYNSGPFTAFSPFELTIRIVNTPYCGAEEYIKLIPKFESWGFPYLSESEQLLTVDKLVPDGHDYSGATALDYEFLLANSKSENVTGLLNARRLVHAFPGRDEIAEQSKPTLRDKLLRK